VIRKAGLWLLWLFLIVELTIHYQTRFIPGTFHSWVLLFGCVATIPLLVQEYGTRPWLLPGDYRIVAAMAIVLVIGYLVNWSAADPLTFQAYVLSLASYVFVREQAAQLSLRHFYAVNGWFLLANSVLMLAQFHTGHYYPARFLAAGNPPLLLPSGFADGPTKNGILHGAALAIVFARVVALRVPLGSIEGAAMLLGGFTLLLTTSRAGVAAFLLTAFACLGVVVFSRAETRMLRARVPALALSTLVFLSVFGGGGYALALPGRKTAAASSPTPADAKSPTAAGKPIEPSLASPPKPGEPLPATAAEQVNAQQYASNVVSFKFVSKARPSAMLSDDSIATRFATMYTAGYILVHYPVHAIIGTGLGTFSTLFARFGSRLPHTGDIDFRDTSAHDSYLEFLVEAGLISFVLLLALVLHVARVALRRRDWVDALPLACMVSVAMGSMLFHDVLRGRVFWVPLGLLAAFAYSRTAADQPAADVTG
jgi:O-Antigen ligase